jgi:uncharacterized phiE125 gp8 family phage protein
MKRLKSLLVTPSSVTPVTLDDAKRRVRRVEDDDDDEIGLIIEAVVSHLEGVDGILGRALISQDWCDSFSGFPAGAGFRLALTPVQSVTALSYTDVDGQVTVFDSSNYRLHTDAVGSYVRLSAGASWPACADLDDAVRVTYRAGYGDAPASVPAAIRLAILDLVAHRFNNREAVVVGTIASELPRGVASDLAPYTRAHF